jgi:hypothetical protein
LDCDHRCSRLEWKPCLGHHIRARDRNVLLSTDIYLCKPRERTRPAQLGARHDFHAGHRLLRVHEGEHLGGDCDPVARPNRGYGRRVLPSRGLRSRNARTGESPARTPARLRERRSNQPRKTLRRARDCLADANKGDRDDASDRGGKVRET